MCFSFFVCFLSPLVWFFLWLPEEVLAWLFLLHRENGDFSILMKDILSNWRVCFLGSDNQLMTKIRCIYCNHSIAVANCSFRHFCLLPMISEFAWRMHVVSPVHRFRWNQVLLLLGFENLQQGLVLGGGGGNVFQTYLIFMWDTTAWCLSQTSGIQMSGMSSACRVSWTGRQLNKRYKSFEFSELQFCPEMVLSMQWLLLGISFNCLWAVLLFAATA